jgi:hypothetical protein
MQITAAVARAKNAPLSLEEVSLAEPRADEVLVRLVAAGICHTAFRCATMLSIRCRIRSCSAMKARASSSALAWA